MVLCNLSMKLLEAASRRQHFERCIQSHRIFLSRTYPSRHICSQHRRRHTTNSIPASSVGRASDSYSQGFPSLARGLSECRGFEPTLEILFAIFSPLSKFHLRTSLGNLGFVEDLFCFEKLCIHWTRQNEETKRCMIAKFRLSRVSS